MPAKIYGHRGALGERAENTLEGFHHAKAVGVAGVETDIVLTRDFVPVLHHDATLPDGRLIRLLNASELPSTIPTLKQALLEVTDIEWMLEIKTDPTAPEQTHPHALIVERVLLDLTQIDRTRLRIWAFEWAVLREIERQAPDLKRVCIAGKQANSSADRDVWWGSGFADIAISDAVAATGAVGRASYHATWTEEDILRTQELGLEVFACILNDQEDFNRLSPLVDGIITDFPSRFVKL
jgi:glycerophosphoryl diester phosphodiesterase